MSIQKSGVPVSTSEEKQMQTFLMFDGASLGRRWLYEGTGSNKGWNLVWRFLLCDIKRFW